MFNIIRKSPYQNIIISRTKCSNCGCIVANIEKDSHSRFGYFHLIKRFFICIKCLENV